VIGEVDSDTMTTSQGECDELQPIDRSAALRDPQRWKWLRAVPLWTERMTQALDFRATKGWFSLKDKMIGDVALSRAFERVRKNAGAPGVDRVTVERFERRLDDRLSRLQAALRDGSYRPQAIRRVEIPKSDGKSKRPLGIPCVGDRVVQAALLETIEPIFEHAFDDASYGFRPGRGCKDALRAVQQGLAEGLVHIVDADLQGYFDSIPHDRLMQRVSRWVKDGGVLSLIDRLIKAEILQDTQSWLPERGTPQGAVLSPLLANIYLHDLDVLLRQSGFRLVRYADDFVVLCRDASQAQQALALVRDWVAQEQLTLHPEKTRIADLSQQGGYVDFLGYRFVRCGEQLQRHIKPKKLTALNAKIKALTPRCWGQSLQSLVSRLNQMLVGVYEYFKHVSTRWPKGGCDLSTLDARVRFRLRRIFAKQRGRLSSGRSIKAHKQWPITYFDQLGLFSMHTARLGFLRSHRGHT
jgi:RNA-directed DNA polymerase